MKHTTISLDQFSLSREDQTLLLGEEDIRFYEQNGYYISWSEYRQCSWESP